MNLNTQYIFRVRDNDTHIENIELLESNFSNQNLTKIEFIGNSTNGECVINNLSGDDTFLFPHPFTPVLYNKNFQLSTTQMT